MLESRSIGLGTPPPAEYAAQQKDVTKHLMEGWNWLEREGLLLRNDQQTTDWYLISSAGEKLLSRNAKFESYEKFGLDRVKHDLLNGGHTLVGGPPETQELAWEWVRIKENKPPKTPAITTAWEMVASSRLEELRAIAATFDFTKLIRLCEELNIASREECFFAIGMLTRAILDHVPPIFGVKNFSDVANNYAGGSKSFKAAMKHLDEGARKIIDGFLHVQIRNNETLPTFQQVNFSQALDALLEEIVRIS